MFFGLNKKSKPNNCSCTLFTSAIILAGGSGTRFGNKIAKQHMTINNVPVIVRSIMAFENNKFINEIIVVAKEDDVSIYQKYIKDYNLTKVSKVIIGGDTRQESVFNGLNALSPKSKYVAIHDGARCLISNETISSVIKAAYRHKAAIAANKATDTIKVADCNGNIDTKINLDRNFVWHAQTPQAFKTSLITACAYSAKKDKFIATDDSSLLERLGYKVKLVECDKNNIKVTYPLDLEISKVLLENNDK